MVFRPRKQQKRRAAPPAPKTSINDIPEELSLQIVGLLPTQDVLNVKLACKNALPACNTVISERCKTLYLHPSKNALRMALEICAHPILNQTIDTIVLLGSPLLAKMGSDHHRHCDCTAEVPPGACCPCQQPSQFHSWPPSVHSQAESLDTIHSGTAFAEEYKPLIDALSKLPRLQSIRFSESTGTDDASASLNRVSSHTIEAHAHKFSQDSLKMSNAAEIAAAPHQRFSDADVLIGLFRNLHCTSFAVEAQLPFIDLANSGAIDRLSLQPTDPFSRLTHLHITLDLGWASNLGVHRAYSGMVKSANTSLLSLRVTFTPNTSTEYSSRRRNWCSAGVGLQLDRIFPTDLQFSTLQKLEMDYARLPAPNGRLYRPFSVAFNPLPLLYSARNTLTHLTIRNVVFAYFEPSPFFLDLTTNHALRRVNPLGWQEHLDLARIATQIVLIVIGECLPRLSHTVWEIPRFRHDPKCRDNAPGVQTFESSDCTRYRCGRYDEMEPQFVSPVPLFELVPQRLGVEVDEETQVWDLGTWVMEKVAERKAESST